MLKIKRGFLLLTLLMLAGFAAPLQPAFAQSPDLPPAIDAQGRVCSTYPGVSGRIVHCIRDAVQRAVFAFMDKLYRYLKNAILAVVTLGVAVYGAMVAMGAVQKPAGDTWVVLLKIACILYFTANFPEIYTMLINAMEDLLSIVTRVVSLSSRSVSCPAAGNDIWARVDCVLDKIIGITPATALTGGLLGALLAFMFTAKFGLAFFFFGAAIILGVLVSVARAVFIFVNSYVGIAIVAIMAPLFVPMVLFRRTKVFFDKWLKILIGFLLQPVILFAYLAFMLSAFDVVVFSGNHSLFVTIAGEQARDPNFHIGHYLIHNDMFTEIMRFASSIDLNPAATNAGTPQGSVETGLMGKAAKLASDYINDSGALKFGASVPNLDTSKFTVDPTQLLISFVTAALMAYVMYSLLKYIPVMATDLSGGVFDVPNLGSSMMPMETRMSGALSGSGNSARHGQVVTGTALPGG